MISKKQIKETYLHKRFNENDEFSVVNAVSFWKDFAVLMSGQYDRHGAGYDVEAVIDRNTGENLIPGQCRPCDDKDDAIDVAFEMIEYSGRQQEG